MRKTDRHTERRRVRYWGRYRRFMYGERRRGGWTQGIF